MRLFSLKAPLTLVTAGLLTGFASEGKAAELIVDAPFQNGTSYGLDTYFTNNDTGAIYDSAEVQLTTTLANQIFALGNSAQASVAEMVNNEWTRTVRGAPAGEVFSGWAATADASGTLQLTHAPFGTNTWHNTQTHPTQDTMALRLGINNDLLSLNALPGHQPFTLSDLLSPTWDPALFDAIIVRSDDPRRLAHPALDPGLDANHNGRSNFIDYATGNDPLAADTPAPVELTATSLTLRHRVNAADVDPQAWYATDLDHWVPLEEGVHVTLQSDTLSGYQRIRVYNILPTTDPQGFFRLGFQ